MSKKKEEEEAINTEAHRKRIHCWGQDCATEMSEFTTPLKNINWIKYSECHVDVFGNKLFIPSPPRCFLFWPETWERGSFRSESYLQYILKSVTTQRKQTCFFTLVSDSVCCFDIVSAWCWRDSCHMKYLDVLICLCTHDFVTMKAGSWPHLLPLQLLFLQHQRADLILKACLCILKPEKERDSQSDTCWLKDNVSNWNLHFASIL